MSALSQDPLALVLVGGAYLLITTGYLWWLNRAAESLLRVIKSNEASTVWEIIGAPESIRQAVQDPRKRWLKFIRTRSYRRLCSPVTASKIDAFRKQTNFGLCALGLAGLAILVRFWPLLKPVLLGA